MLSLMKSLKRCDMEPSSKSKRDIFVATALGGVGLLAMLPKKAKAAVGEENIQLTVIASAAKSIKETMESWKKSYDSMAKEMNQHLSMVKPIKDVAEDLHNIDKEVRRKKKQAARLANRLHRGVKNPQSFRFPHIDPFTTDILEGIERRYRTFEAPIQSLMNDGKKGKAKQVKNVIKSDTQVNLGTAAARAQRNELERLKKVAARNAKDESDEDINELLKKTSLPYILETMQQQLEATRQNGEILSQILQTLSGTTVNTSSTSLDSIKESIKSVQEGQGTFINDKGV